MSQRAAWLEIDLSIYRSNLLFFKNLIGPSTGLCLCLKANAYGHGLLAMAEAAAPYADAFSIATVEEGILLRQAGVTKPILLLSPHGASQAPDVARFELQPLVSDASLFSAYAATGLPIKLHLKVDTGMGRLGCLPEEAVPLAEALASYPNLKWEGLCTHFADAEENPEATSLQIALFEGASKLLKARGLLPPLRHACNSAGTLHHPEAHYQMVRVGSGAVGYVLGDYPHPRFPEILLCASLRARVVLVKKIAAGAKVSYEGTWTAPRPTVIGIVPLGYGDALPPSLAGKGSFWVNGKEAPIIGKVCMDQTILDLTDIPNPLGAEVTVFGTTPEQSISQLAKRAGVSVSSILTLLPERLPRIHLN